MRVEGSGSRVTPPSNNSSIIASWCASNDRRERLIPTFPRSAAPPLHASTLLHFYTSMLPCFHAPRSTLPTTLRPPNDIFGVRLLASATKSAKFCVDIAVTCTTCAPFDRRMNAEPCLHFSSTAPHNRSRLDALRSASLLLLSLAHPLTCYFLYNDCP